MRERTKMMRRRARGSKGIRERERETFIRHDSSSSSFKARPVILREIFYFY